METEIEVGAKCLRGISWVKEKRKSLNQLFTTQGRLKNEAQRGD